MILISGGAGYIGSHANKLLNCSGYNTIVYDNLSQGHREFVKWGHFICGDLANQELLRHCFKTYPIDSVMHFGALIEVGESIYHPSDYYHNNVANTLNLLDVMVEYNVKYFIYSSICAIYEPSSHHPIAEDHPQQPTTAYGKSKFMVEKILEDYDSAYGIRSVCLRYFNAAGVDPAWLFSPDTADRQWACDFWKILGIDVSKPLVGVNAVNERWPGPTYVKKAIAVALDRIIRETGMQAAFLCNETREGEYFDASAAREVIGMM